MVADQCLKFFSVLDIKEHIYHRISHLSWPWAQQLSQSVLANAGCLCDRAALLRDLIKETPVQTTVIGLVETWYGCKMVLSYF